VLTSHRGGRKSLFFFFLCYEAIEQVESGRGFRDINWVRSRVAAGMVEWRLALMQTLCTYC